MSIKGICSVCGCTANNACVDADYGACWWTNEEKTLCSHCAPSNHPRGLFKHKLDCIFREISIVKHYYPMGSVSTNQSELMLELSNLYHEDKLEDVFIGREIVLQCVDFDEICDDWLLFNDWIEEENITGYIAELNTPINLHSTHSFGRCHVDFIYYESEIELLEKCKIIVEYWKNHDSQK